MKKLDFFKYQKNTMDFERIDFLNNRAELIQIDTYFCSLSIDDSNGILKLGESFQTKELMGLREQGMIASLAYPNRSYCKKKSMTEYIQNYVDILTF